MTDLSPVVALVEALEADLADESHCNRGNYVRDEKFILAIRVTAGMIRAARRALENWQLDNVQSKSSLKRKAHLKGKVECNPHPDAPHGFDRNSSHSEDRYVCECEHWIAPPTTTEAEHAR